MEVFDAVRTLLAVRNCQDKRVPPEIDPFGYPARPIGKGKKKRKSIAEVAHLERFGQPFE